ncbi:Protein Skeletor, isoforms B/C [Holothuria leucospilota]|uniref:Protein Skeletor, isoforms B/C n=1 Tax=Holothuria leucospilota TaxID=206669 RepID=A0A9Q0YQ11_HOLLE|nr:Protein Skeletor, isoforms B/C [Holothuria leucospilota]
MENFWAFAALIALASAAETEYGNLIGDFTGTIHKVTGTVYAVDERTFYIRGFSYDGTAPATVFYTGTTQEPAAGGLSIPVPGAQDPNNLREYNLEDVMITIPDGRTIKDFRWLSVWCVSVGVNFGHVNIPDNLVTPETKSLGSFGFSQRVHDVAADDVIILNSKQFKFINLDYDGRGPAAYFWTGDGQPDSNDIRVPHPADQPNAILPRYSGATVTVTLQEGLSVEDVDFIGIWCELAKQNFGHISIQSSDVTDIPPYIKPLTTPVPPSNLDNCKVLVPDRFQIAWTLDEPNNKIQMEFRGLLSLNEYLAFGISGSPSGGTLMIGSDVTVVWFDPSTNEPKAEDYLLNQYSQCLPEQGIGACPDTLQGSEENVVLISGDLTNGVAVILIERPINSPDPQDLPIPTTEDVYVSWGIGFINPTGHVAKHDIRPSDDVLINFGQSSSTCPPLKTVDDAQGGKEPWYIPPLRPEGNATFTAVIGPSGGKRGYVGRAGQVGWGLLWYVNGMLIPEIYVTRGNTYTFIIYGGNDVSVSGNYHPFYITDDKDGGYAQKTDAEKELETIYAAPVEGDLCEYKAVKFVSDDKYYSFLSYASSLQLKCPANAVPGILKWTPDENTPDLVYYQCYQHRFFGWKIHVSKAACGTQMSFALLMLCLQLFLFLH